jgi:class 3 adenylate cyclase
MTQPAPAKLPLLLRSWLAISGTCVAVSLIAHLFIGLNTDHLLVGNIGSHELLDYTAIGDGMNLAARLEAANKAYGTLILIGENTYLAVAADVVAREVDLVRVPGKQHRQTITGPGQAIG